MKPTWRAPFALLAVLAVCAASAGCGGPKLIQVKGQVIKDGAPLKSEEGDPPTSLTVIFSPVVEGGNAEDAYRATILDPQQGTFEVPGRTGKGIPPGKYRIVIMRPYGPNRDDLLNGAFSGQNGKPFVRELLESQELTIDLGKPEE